MKSDPFTGLYNIIHVDTPFLTDSSPGESYAVSSSDKSTCESKLGRTCAANSLVSSGSLSASDESVLSSWPSGESGITVTSASRVRSSVLSNAGIGKLSSSSSKRHVQPAPSVPVHLQAGPGATPVSHPASGLRRRKTVGVKPTKSPQPSANMG
ncbi:hypothetical protein N7486_008886 [Penicillium sp. IBT 16267x]|nr:hypothetical protein N7486_008886 [Penicillium sp. IBT 16267x]